MNPIGVTPQEQGDLPLEPDVDSGSVTYQYQISDLDPTDIASEDDIPFQDDNELRGAVLDVERQHRIRNAGFIQVSKAYIDEINDLARHAPAANHILWTLVKLMSKQNSVMISQESLAKMTKFSKVTVKRGVALLRKQHWIDVLKMGTANVYRINSEVMWQDKADGRWASFSARIILNFDEQDEETKKLKAPVRTRHIPFVEADDLAPSASHPRDPNPRGNL